MNEHTEKKISAFAFLGCLAFLAIALFVSLVEFIISYL
jgi:hypothetical protein